MKKQCSNCHKRVEIPQSDYKYLDKKGEFMCSSSCMLEWLDEAKTPGIRRPEGYVIPQMESPDCCYSDLCRLSFRSRYEKAVAEMLWDNGVEFLYEPHAFPLSDESESVYIPDFYLPDHGIYVEVKGKWGVGGQTKINKFRELFNVRLLVLPWVIRDSFVFEEVEDVWT